VQRHPNMVHQEGLQIGNRQDRVEQSGTTTPSIKSILPFSIGGGGRWYREHKLQGRN
jgi:hypothetical protein